MPKNSIAQTEQSFTYIKSANQHKGFKAYIYVQTKQNKPFSEPRFIDTFKTKYEALDAAITARATTPNAIAIEIVKIEWALFRRGLHSAKKTPITGAPRWSVDDVKGVDNEQTH